ncbi:MAG: tRNA (adenosine(37)-N6)-threonylcarbamoyltransferase complex dimerization subunit type 1 TsaB [Gemmatimonadaceae bacterium]
MDAPYLAIDASTYEGSVAIVRGSDVLHDALVPMRGEHEERLMPAVAAALDACGLRPGSLSFVACGAGPGSFTSLRIAGAIAKGLAVSGRRPLVVASSLALTAAAQALSPGRYLVTSNAMRGEVYLQGVQVHSDGFVSVLDEPALATDSRVAEILRSSGWQLVGGSDDATGPILRARGFSRLTPGVLAEVDTATWEPVYGRLAEAQVQWERRHGRPLDPSSA